MAEQTGCFGNGSTSPDPHSPRSGRFTCVPLSEPDVEPAARLYTEVFLADEPTTRRYAPDPAFFLHHAQFYVRSLVRKKLSFIARHPGSQDPAGFIFCIDLTEDPRDEGESMVVFLAHFREVIGMLNELEERYISRNEIVPGSVLHIFQIGVSRNGRGRGIAQTMIRRVLDQARERGFRQVIADCTNPASKRAFEQCGFSEAGFLPYDAFSMNGIRFFAGLDGGISLMVKDI